MTCQRRAARSEREFGGVVDDGASVAISIVTMVADREGVEPQSLDTPLYEAVDPDALATLVQSAPETQLTISFNYAGYRVTVVSDEEVVVDVTPLA
ncbi:hypothetical protein JCM30237_25760 [Halolamina litorea]|jgi:hypothetical protein|uniref:HalOD1 output domain-containing protein n=1 Tax=Halolamina litorea TaxID=1515593 RepID=A0ABD6BTX6_9EURY|nr:HalOD1 output domain-containing protein [Halolamina litorea]